MQEISKEKKIKIEREYERQVKNNTIPYEITIIEKSLLEIENYFVKQEKLGFFKKLIGHLSTPSYIKDFLL